MLYTYTKSYIALTAVLSSRTVAGATKNWSPFVWMGIEKINFDLNNIFFVVEVYVFFVFLRLELWGICTLWDFLNRTVTKLRVVIN